MSNQLKLAGRILALALILAPGAAAQSKEYVLHAFSGGDDASFPTSALVADAAGNLYGEGGGGAHGFGAIFKLTRTSGGWKESVVFAFPGGEEGNGPAGNLVRDATGNLYGTTIGGGNTRLCHGSGCGTVFELSPSSDGKWKETVLYRFGGCKTDGCRPYGGVIFDMSGNLYGTTSGGVGPKGAGTVFMLSPTSNGWSEAILHSFTNGDDGAQPSSGLVLDSVGNLFGVTQYQGGSDGCGTVFEVSPTSGGEWQEKSIHVFSGGDDGRYPNGPLILDKAGNLYGTTFYGGTSNLGVAFELRPASGGTWTENVLHDFVLESGNEAYKPDAGLVFDAAGNLYGTTYYGGGLSYCDQRGCGTVFQLTPGDGGKWTESVLHSFTAGNDGQNPTDAVIVEAGKLYGTTLYGGAHNDGVVFEVKP